MFEEELDATQVQYMWDEIGLTPEEKQAAKNNFYDEICEIKRSFCKFYKEKRNEMKESIEKKRNTLYSLVSAIEHNKKELDTIKKLGREGTLKERMMELDKHALKYKSAFDNESKRFYKVKKETDALFERLGVLPKDRGEFDDIGYEDLSNERHKRFLKKKEELNEEVSRRLNCLPKNEDLIKKLLCEVGEPMDHNIINIFSNKIITNEAFETMSEYYDQLQALRNTRASKMASMMMEITDLWETLGVKHQERQSYVDGHSVLSQESLLEVHEEIERLKLLIEENYPNLINNLKRMVRDRCQAMYKTPDQIEHILFSATRNETYADNFRSLQNCLLQLKREFLLSRDAFRMIEQREAIMKEYKEALEYSEDPKQSGDKNQIIRINKAKRRNEQVLPRLESKLLLELREYKKKTNRDLTYNGILYELNLRNVNISESDLLNTSSTRGRKSFCEKRQSLEGVKDLRIRRNTEWSHANQ